MHGEVKVLFQDGKPVDFTVGADAAAAEVRERLEARHASQAFRVANPWVAPALPQKLFTIRYRKF